MRFSNFVEIADTFSASAGKITEKFLFYKSLALILFEFSRQKIHFTFLVKLYFQYLNKYIVPTQIIFWQFLTQKVQ